MQLKKVEQVILVNEKDEQTGTMEKMEAHLTGTLHRAFSVFIFNNNGEMLLQQRAAAKYHFTDRVGGNDDIHTQRTVQPHAYRLDIAELCVD